MGDETNVTFVTGNMRKFAVAERVMRGSGVRVEQCRLDVPEIQSADVEAVAAFSAQWAYAKLNTPVVVHDTGFHIQGLNGFPGPFIKYVNDWLTTDDLLRLMDGKANRGTIGRDCLAYCADDDRVVCFSGEYPGTLATVAGAGPGTPMERLFIPRGYHLPTSELTPEAQANYWATSDAWRQFKAYLAALDTP